MKLTKKPLLQEIARGAQLVFENAEKLFDEAQLLRNHGAFARALTLHQISMEECSKVDLLGPAAVLLVMGHPVDLDKLATTLRDHKLKNYNNADMSVITDEEREARRRGDVIRATQIFESQQADIHRLLNGNKNASLYVDYSDSKFISPSERITEELAAQIQQLNAFFLRQASLHVRLLNKLASDPDAAAMQTRDLVGRLDHLKASGSDLDEKRQEIVAAWLEEQRGRARDASGKP